MTAFGVSNAVMETGLVIILLRGLVAGGFRRAVNGQRRRAEQFLAQ
jgi:hypothetical protein